MRDDGKLEQSALVMKILGWGLIVGSTGALVYPPGFLWGSNPAVFPFICWQHPASPYDGLHPYLLMMSVMYLSWAILMIRGSRNPRSNSALFDYGILANVLHGLVMIPQAFIYPNEHPHLWTDVPLLFVISSILWVWHPNRAAPAMSRARVSSRWTP